MPRKHLIRSSEYPYQIIARTNNREWFQLPMQEVWQIFCICLEKTCSMYGLEIGLFVLMSNHIHTIVWTPKENLDVAMNYFLREVSKKINHEAGRMNHLFGGPYKWSLIMTEEYLSQAYRYNYQNALAQNMVEKAEDYKYSTLFNLTNSLETPFQLHDQKILDHCSLIPTELGKRLVWLNEKYSDLQREAISHASKKAIFKTPKYNKYRNLF